MLDDLRIVSLLPSATEILAELGLMDAIAGRSHECDFPPDIQDRPVCTAARLNSEQPSAAINTDVQHLVQSALSIYSVHLDVLEQIQPTHIVTQDQCNVCAVSFDDVQTAVASLTQSQPTIISLQPNRLNDVWADIERVGTQLGVDPQPVLAKLRARVDWWSQKTQLLSDEKRPTVAAIEWTEPLMASGNWIPELVELAGGRNLFGKVGTHSPWLEWESLLAGDPDIIVIMPCGFGLERTRQETTQLAQHPQWGSLKAVMDDRVYVTDGNSYFNRPGPRLVDSLEILVEILHPQHFQLGYRGTGWERFA